MSDQHLAVNLEHQAEQSRAIKRMEAENSQLRARADLLEAALQVIAKPFRGTVSSNAAIRMRAIAIEALCAVPLKAKNAALQPNAEPTTETT